MDILVIGNGFDLAHGLPTRYTDFLDYIYKKKADSTKSGNDSNFSLIERNEGLLKCIHDNIWIKYFLKKKDILKKEGKENWIDFEKEISAFIQCLDTARLSNDIKNEYIKRFLKGNSLLTTYPQSGGFIQQLPMIKQRLIDDLNNLIRALEIYLTSHVQSIDLIGRKAIPEIVRLSSTSKLKVLSFNYTDTYQRIYAKDSEKISNKDFDYIHGKAEEGHTIQTCNMVLGIDEYLKGEDRDNDNEFIQFKKFYQRIFKKTGSKYTTWLPFNRFLSEQNNNKLNIYFFGHSLDPTDGDIIRSLILAKGANTTIYYHDEVAFEQQIMNLVKIIGEENLIRMTGENTKKIVFKKQENK